jgi:hypothetical protein
MLSDRNVETINDQIAKELRDLNSLFTADEDKPAIMERIVALKSLLDPQQPTPDDLFDMFAAKLAGYINNEDQLFKLVQSVIDTTQ